MSTRSDVDRIDHPSPSAGVLGSALRHWWPIVLLIAAAAVIASVVTTSGREPQYEATANLLVAPLSQDDTSLFGTTLIRDAGDAAQTPPTVAVLAKSNTAAAETARRLGGSWTRGTVLEAVTPEAVDGTNIVAVTATANRPEVAAELANTFADAFVRERRTALVPELERRFKSLAARRRRLPDDDYSQRDRLFTEMRLIENTLAGGGDPTLRLAETAAPSNTAVGRSPLINGAIALLAGLVVGIAAAVGLERLRARSSPRRELAAAA